MEVAGAVAGRWRARRLLAHAAASVGHEGGAAVLSGPPLGPMSGKVPSERVGERLVSDRVEAPLIIGKKIGRGA